MTKNVFGERYILVAENLTTKQVIDIISSALNVPSPKKEISKNWVIIVAYFQKIVNLFTSKKPSIPLEIIDSLFEKSEYENLKIKKAIDFKFTSVKENLKEVATHFAQR